MTATPAPFPGRVDGTRVDIDLQPEALISGDRTIDWNDVDRVDIVRESPLSLRLTLADATSINIDQLGPRGDEFGATLREFRSMVRGASLTQNAWAPVAEFVVHEPDSTESDVRLFPHVLVIEARSGAGLSHIPLPLLRDVTRDGWVFHFHCRGIDDIDLRGFGPRTDEFELRLAETREALNATTRAAVTTFEPGLEGLDLADGWAITTAEAGAHAPALVERWANAGRAEQVKALTDLVGADHVRYGMWTEGGTVTMPFVLAIHGEGQNMKVAVEAVDADDRATFVFAVDDVDRFNAALILSAFRREVLSLPDAELGRWAVAVRMQPHVQWMRERLVARIVHDTRWAEGIAASLAP
jgi:hypothetical protein